MLEFQIEYPRHVAVLRAGVPRNRLRYRQGCQFSGRDRSRHLRQSSAIRKSPEKVHAFAQGLGCSSTLPCAEPVFHSLDYQIELVAFRNWIRYG